MMHFLETFAFAWVAGWEQVGWLCGQSCGLQGGWWAWRARPATAQPHLGGGANRLTSGHKSCVSCVRC